jgi:hypothetical protein
MIRFLKVFEQEGKFMKRLQIGVLAVLAMVLFTAAADAQKRPAKRKAVKQPVSSTSTVAPLEVRTAREKVAIQLENVNRFIDLLGPIAQGIENLERTAREKPLSPAANDKNETNKRNVISAIRNLRDGLSALESEFRTKLALKRYQSSISGITDLAARSEDSAIAGDFIASKDPLRQAARKLADTLNLLPITGVAGSNLTSMNIPVEQSVQYQVIKEPREGDGPSFTIGTFRTKAEADRRAAQEAAKAENSGYRFIVQKVE